jgi:hypothetical protein
MQYRSTFTMLDGSVEVREHTSLHALSEYIHNLHWRGDKFADLSVTKL